VNKKVTNILVMMVIKNFKQTYLRKKLFYLKWQKMGIKNTSPKKEISETAN
jgi:hypothetical protein